MLHVPFKGAAESLTALISSQTDLQFAKYCASEMQKWAKVVQASAARAD